MPSARQTNLGHYKYLVLTMLLTAKFAITFKWKTKDVPQLYSGSRNSEVVLQWKKLTDETKQHINKSF